MSLTPLLPDGWPRPSGFSHAMLGAGRIVCLGGQIGWDSNGVFASGLVAQTRQALANVLTVLAVAGGGPADIARLTWYVTDIAAYRDNLRPLGEVWRAVMGRHYPAMALVGVTALVEPLAFVEIEATAILSG